MGVRWSRVGSQSASYSLHLSRRTLPPPDSTTPASRTPSTLVPLARERVSASPKGPALQPYWSNQAAQNWVSASKLPDSGLRYSVMARLISTRASCTLILEPSWISTASYLEKMAMPGPMAAWARSTGAMGVWPVSPPIIASSATGSSWRNSLWKSLLEITSELSVFFLHTSTIDDANALDP